MENNFEKSDVQHFISYLEGIINRMASNSADCKNWLLAIFAGCMAMQPSMQSAVDKICLAYPLVILFCLLDSYYLLNMTVTIRNFSQITPNIINQLVDSDSKPIYNF